MMSNRGQFGYILNAQEHTGNNGNAQEHTGMRGKYEYFPTKAIMDAG